MPAAQSDDLLDVMRRVCAALRDGGVPFALAGGLAAWARGGPPTEHDVDLVLQERDAERALSVLDTGGLRTGRPPEGWLVKAWDGDILVDMIFRPAGLVVDAAYLDRCEVLSVHAIRVPVISANDLLATKLSAIGEHHLDYAPPLQWARALREQIDWRLLAHRTAASPFARAVLTLVTELGIAPDVDLVAARGARLEAVDARS
jgi:hypothetical protein